MSRAGLTACVSASVVRQGAASRQMPNPAELAETGSCRHTHAICVCWGTTYTVTVLHVTSTDIARSMKKV